MTRSKEFEVNLITVAFFIILAGFYYFEFANVENASIYTGMATFLFAIFLTYFITRQNNRFSKIRMEIAANDGNFSTVYRVFRNFGLEVQKEAGGIISTHYKKILKTHNWLYHTQYKSSTLTLLNELISRVGSKKDATAAEQFSIRQIQQALANIQVLRKTIWSLQKERITFGQWFLIIFLALVLLVTISLIPNAFFIVYCLKVLFGFIIVMVLVLLFRIDRFLLFKDSYGLKSSQDVIAIIEGKK